MVIDQGSNQNTSDQYCSMHSQGAVPAAVCIRQVSKRFGNKLVINDVSLSLPHGNSLALAGLNGAGKTSLLRMMLNFSRPDRGSITIYGHDASLAISRQALVYLPEKFNPSPDLTGIEVLRLLAGLRGQTVDRERYSAELLHLDFPDDALTRPIRTLSKGMTQKLGLCAAIMADCPLTILDEPFSGLDPIARRTVGVQLKRMRDAGRSLLFTTHSLDGLSPLFDQIGIVHQAGLRFLGSSQELLNRFEQASLEAAFIRCVEQPNLESIDEQS